MKLAAPFRILVLLAALAAFLLLAGSGLGYRLGWWEYRKGFDMLSWALFTGLGAALLAIVALALPKVRAGWRASLAVALVVSLAVAYVPWHWRERAQSVPRIHDISTDTENPPRFVAVLPLRKGAPNTAEYGGKEVADAQRKGYPDIQPKMLDAPPQVAFARALDTAERMGWTLVANDPAEGRIEATDTTFWFGFKDDIVIRVTPAGAGSRVDVRSVSRTGRSDIGTNAKRVRDYLAKLAS
jgi:uncharacterized protein (DUF1499 family)